MLRTCDTTRCDKLILIDSHCMSNMSVKVGTAPLVAGSAYAGSMTLPVDEVDPQLYEYFSTRGNVILPDSDCEYP